MTLTTPELKQYDTVFPGENWFFYWRTSPSLWESKLAEYQGPTPLFIPLYWGLHSEHPDQFDFGTYRPETDLARLSKIAEHVGKNIIFVLPTSPAPFLPSGGLPTYLARNLIIGENGLGSCAIDNEGRLHKMFSFYDPRVFQSFRKFTWNLSQYFSQAGVNVEIYSAELGYLKNDQFNSYFLDQSVAFSQGFQRYLKQLETSEPDNFLRLQNDPHHEATLKVEYGIMIKDLYVQATKESMPANYSGHLKFAFLGGASDDVFARSSELWEYHGDFFRPLFSILVNNLIPASVLLSPQVRKPILTRALRDIMSHNYLISQLDNSAYDEDLHLSFRPLVFFDLYLKANDAESFNLIHKSGLKYFFDREYHWMYRYHFQSFKLTTEEDEHMKVRFFYGRILTKETFNEMLKLFLNGGKIFLDETQMSSELTNKLSVFMTENNISLEKINYLTPVTKAQIGEGILITYDNDKLAESMTMKKVGFWETMLKFLQLKHVNVQADEGVYYFWKHRMSNTYELNYQEVRRVTCYNPSSYKRKVHLASSRNYAFLKTVDDINATVRSTPIGLDVELFPGGAVSIDYGYFE
jgi:hypothetical protein